MVRGPQLGRLALRVLRVGGDDPLHELVAHDVLAAEAALQRIETSMNSGT
jgi:hypothetical protein